MHKQIALFFDIDGTLFDSKTKSILPSTKYILEELRKRQNYDLYLSSGRSYVTLGTLKPYEKYFKGMNLTNGQEIYINDDIYYGDVIDKKVIEQLLKRASENNISLGLILKDDIVINFFTEESYHNFTNYIKAQVKNLNHQPFDTSKEVLQIWLFASNDIVDEYRKEFTTLDFIDWGNYGADVLPRGLSKANGIKKIADIMGYQKENMYAFGDGDNDAFMFKEVGTSVAMGNGSMLAKRSATMVTDDISNDGLYKAVKKLNLL